VTPHPLAFDPEVHKLIQAKVRRLAASRRLRIWQVDDMVQELWVRLLHRLVKHPARPGKEREWIRMLLRHGAVTFLRDALAKKRDDRRTVSGQASRTENLGHPMPLESLFRQDEARKHRGVGFQGELEQVEQAIDVNDILKTVPKEVQEIAERLKHQSPAEVARELNIPRCRVYRTIQTLRTLLAPLREKNSEQNCDTSQANRVVT
jgi:RNA polymerase sigma factor (sigma-70 family)